MCKVCDRLNQWVCDCARINRVGSVCECGGERSGDESSLTLVESVDYRRPNRAARRGGTRIGY